MGGYKKNISFELFFFLRYFDRCIWQGYLEHGQFPTNMTASSCKFSGLIPSNEIWNQFQEKYSLQLSEILIDAAVIEQQITEESKESGQQN